MNTAILKAINQRQLLSFSYKGGQRRVEPHTYGRQPSGHDYMCAWQLAGGSGSDFRFYRLDEMLGIAIEQAEFEGPRFGYRKGDRRFSQIYAEL
jgi:predicted DNA-binding transcriptional regulator YafY